MFLLSCLEVDGNLGAYLYGYLYKQVYYAYNTAFLEDYRDYFPGKLIMNETLKYVQENGGTAFEFLRGGTYFKKRWTQKTRIQNNLFWIRSKPINFLYILVVFQIRPLLKKTICIVF